MTSDRLKSFRITKVHKRETAKAAADAGTRKPPPEFAKKADDLDAIRKAVDDAAAVSGGLWLSYIFTLFYLAIAAGAVTHVDLLLERPVRLPFLNIDLPLLAFFFLAPILFVIVHVYTLSHFVLFSRKAVRYHDALYEKHPDRFHKPDLSDEVDKQNADARNGLRRLLPSNIFVQFLAGPPEVREAGFGLLLKFIAWMTLVFGPILLLLLLQIQFLPYHSSPITWTQRLMLALDLVILWWLWRKILWGRSDLRQWGHSTTIVKTLIAGTASIAAFALSWTVVTFPGEWLDAHEVLSWKFAPTEWAEPARNSKLVFHKWFEWQQKPQTEPISPLPGQRHIGDVDFNPIGSADQYSIWCGSRPRRISNRPPPPVDRAAWAASSCPVSLRDWLLAGHVDSITRRRTSPFSNTLILPGLDIIGSQESAKANKHEQIPRSINLRGRHLEGAVLSGANLGKADLTGAFLEYASLDVTQLSGSIFKEAQLRGASLDFAHLEGAIFDQAILEGASLYKSHLQGAFLRRTKLQGAKFGSAQLQRASLNDARLDGASLNSAQLQDAILDRAQLQGAQLDFAQLQGASLDDARLAGVSLMNANLRGANLRNAQIQGTVLQFVDLQGALLASAELQGTFFFGASLQGSSFAHAKMQGASFFDVTIRATSFSGATLWRSVGRIAESGAVSGISEVEWLSGLNPWTTDDYLALHDELEKIPPGHRRVDAMNHVKILACAAVDEGKTCNVPPGFTRNSETWRAALENAQVNKARYSEALTDVLSELVCGTDTNAIYILRGLVNNGLISETAREAPRLVARIEGKDKDWPCLVSKHLSEDDRAKLDSIEERARKLSPPPPPVPAP